MWLCPTQGRALTNVPRLLKACAATNMTTPAVLVVDDEEYAANFGHYDALKLPSNWHIHTTKGGSSGIAFEEARRALCPGAEWVGFLSDDLIPETPEWDTKLIAHLLAFGVVSCNDGAHAPKRLNGAVVWSRDLIYAVGYVYPPDLAHMFVDDVWEELGKATGVWHCDMSVMVRHAHASWGGLKDATMKRANAFTGTDQRVFEAWKRSERADAIDRIFALMAQNGIEVNRIDLRGVKIMLAVPVGDGTFDRVFMRSWVQTRDAVRQYGGDIELAEAPFMSDLCLARSKLFGAFLRSDCTHCFWVDSDQGWQVKDLIRLIAADKPFVAAAGVRKTVPPSFAVNNTDDFGNPVMIQHSADRMLIKVSHVGFAFVLTTHEWAVRMSQHYADLAYVGADGMVDYAVFNSMVVNKQYRGEDFACCQRWRDMGGEVFICPEINLEHVGCFVFQGDWLTSMAEAGDRQRAQAA